MTIGKFVRKPLLAFTAGVASHALLDCLPHEDGWYPKWRLICGSLTVAALACACNGPSRAAKLAGAVGALLPDVESVPHLEGAAETKKLFPSHWFRHEDHSGRHGVVTEGLIVAVTLAIYLNYRSKAKSP